ncbi:hypothetical protein ACHAWC_004622, partial [Mediolabrus comicus]
VDDDAAPADAAAAADDSDDSDDDPLNPRYNEGQAPGFVPLEGSELARECGISNATITKLNLKDSCDYYNNSLMCSMLNGEAYSIRFNNSDDETFFGYRFHYGLEHAHVTNNVLEGGINIGCLVCPDAIQRATSIGYKPEGRYAVVEGVVKNSHSFRNMVLICDTWTGCFYDSHSKATASSDTTELSDIVTLSNLEELVRAGESGFPKGWRHLKQGSGGGTNKLISPLGVIHNSIQKASDAAKITQLATMREVLTHLKDMKRWSDVQMATEWHQVCPDDYTFGSMKKILRRAINEGRSDYNSFTLQNNTATSLLKFIASALSRDDYIVYNDPNVPGLTYCLNNNVNVGDDVPDVVREHLVATTVVEVNQLKRKRGDDNAGKGAKVVYRLMESGEHHELRPDTLVAVKIESLTDVSNDSIPTDDRNEYMLLNFDGVFHVQKEGNFVQLSATRVKKAVNKRGKKKASKKSAGGTKEEKEYFYLTLNKVDESLFVFVSAGEPLTLYKETNEFMELKSKYEQLLAGVVNNVQYNEAGAATNWEEV